MQIHPCFFAIFYQKKLSPNQNQVNTEADIDKLIAEAKKYEANQQIKREYQPDLRKFFINKALQQYDKKSGGMIHGKIRLQHLRLCV